MPYTMFKTLSFFLVLFISSGPVMNVAAQVDTTGVLPDIAPQEVEIRGQLEIAFPSLRRQPLIGFNPPPPVPGIPAGRRPFAEDYRESSADFPVSPLRRPQPPSSLIGAAYPPARGSVDVGGGRYFSRFAHVEIGGPVSEDVSLFTRFDYLGMKGHEPFSIAPDVNTPFDAAEGQVGLQYQNPTWMISGAINGFFETYDLFGTVPLAGLNALLPDRDGRGGGGVFRVRSLGDMPVELAATLRLSGSRYETDLSGGEPSSAAAIVDITERRVSADLSVQAPLDVTTFWAEGKLSTGLLTDDLGNLTSAEGGGGVQFEINDAVVAKLGVRVLAALSDTDQPRTGTTERTRFIYVSPDVRVDWVAAEGIQLYVQNHPHTDANTLTDLYRTNPYMVPQPILRPSLFHIDAEVGGRFFAGPIQVGVQGGFQDMPQYLFFEQATGSEGQGFSRGFAAPRYGEAEVWHVGGSFSVVLPGGLHAVLGATYREGQLIDEATDIPYFSPVIGEATLSYSFLQSRGLLQVTGAYNSKRYLDRAQRRQLDPFMDLDVEAAYNVTSSVGILVRVDNIHGGYNAFWDNYEQASTVFGVGARIRW